MSKLLIKSEPRPQLIASAEIPLIGGGFAIVSAKDFFWLNIFSWRLFHGNYKDYAYRRWSVDGKTRTVKMHREIMNPMNDEETHHKDLNGLNNTRENLENLTPLNHRLAHGKSR